MKTSGTLQGRERVSTPSERMRRGVVAAAAALCALYVALAVIGIARAHTPVPLWDMWDSYIGFFLRVLDGDPAAWLAQHNEHRIVLARALFWLDLTLFGGAGWFLLLVNFLLAGALSILLVRFLRDEIKADGAMFVVLALTIVALSYSWIQRENLVWGFQSPFFLTLIFPLLAFRLLARSAETGSRLYFAGALGCGVAAAGALANGVLALPLMVALGLALRVSPFRIALIAAAAIVTAWLYFRNYATPPHHSSLVASIVSDPLGFIGFSLAYIGQPLARAFRIGEPLFAAAGGLLLCVATIGAVGNDRRNRRLPPHRAALYAFLLYVALAAAATAGGRLVFGLEAANASRYTTPALMAWLAVLVLHARSLAEMFERRPRIAASVPLGALVLLSLSQFAALKPRAEQQFERRLTALALELGVADEARVETLYPTMSDVLEIAQRASLRDLSVFGAADIEGAREMIGKPPPPGCVRGDAAVLLDAAEPIPGEAKFVRMSGRTAASTRRSTRVVFLDDDGDVAGVALVASRVDADQRSVRGYARADAPIVATAVCSKSGRP